MVIAKGEPWGEPDGPEPVGVVSGDAEIARRVEGERAVVVGVLGGDLHRTLGLGATPRSSPQWFPMDLGFVSIDGGAELPFAAHAVARSRSWLGPAAVVMNAAWLGDRYLGPRAHPNDGLLDITVGSLPPRQLIVAAQRSRSGTHLPHPDLQVKRVATWDHEFDRSRAVWLDGRRVGRGRRLRLRVEPDWFVLVG